VLSVARDLVGATLAVAGVAPALVADGEQSKGEGESSWADSVLGLGFGLGRLGPRERKGRQLG
jgi:hypothetical protein